MKNNKSIAFRGAIIIICLSIIVGSVAILSSCRDKTPSESIDIPAFTISNGGESVFDSQAPQNVSVALTDGKLTFDNLSKSGITLELHYSAEDEAEPRTVELTAEQESKVEGEISKSGVLEAIYFSYTKEDSTTNCSFVFSETGINIMANGKPDYIILPISVQASKIEFSRPLSFIIDSCKFNCQEIYLNTELSGNFIIEEKDTGELDCDSFYADAVNVNVKIPKIKDVNSNPEYYLRVKTYNSKTVDYLDISVDSLEKFTSLIDDNKLPTLYSGTKITLSDFKFAESVILDKPISFHFSENFTLENPINITTDSECQLSYSADEGATLPSIPVIINAPAADVTWDIPRLSGITLFDIASSMTAATLNGKAPNEYALGGDGNSKLSSIILDKETNKNITESISWKQDGYVFTAIVDCVVDIKTLQNAILDLKATNGGTIKFDESVTTAEGRINLLANSGCYLTVTDSNGKNVRYLIETNYIQSKIPVVVINTDGGAAIESNEEYIGATCYMNCDAATGFTGISEEAIEIRGRGHSTWKWDKKPYKIKFESKTSLFGLEAAKDWVLLANYTDKSLIRNFVAMEGARVLDNLTFVGVQYPVDLFVNGEYLGVYTMGEQIEAKNGRVELTDNGLEPDTGFLLEIGGTSSEDVWNETCFYTTLCKYVKVKAPDEESLTKEQVAYIKDYVKKADEAVMSGVGYEDYIDIDSLIDWVIVHELYYNIDSCFRRSCYFTKEPGGKLTMGPIWDFDNAFGNFWKDDKTYSTWATADSTTGYIWDNWMSYLINYPEFRMKFKARWDEVKYELLEKLLESIDTGAANIERSAEYNFRKWDILNKRVGCQDSSIVKYNTFEKQINYFRDFVNKRWKWLDENI